MIIVVDANILISAILTPTGIASDILQTSSDEIEFVSPLFVQEEIVSKKERLCREADMSSEYFFKSLEKYYNNILFFSDKSITTPELLKAWELTKDIDSKDSLYVAVAIMLDGLLWTGDLKLYRALRRKGFMNVAITKELIEIFKGL